MGQRDGPDAIRIVSLPCPFTRYEPFYLLRATEGVEVVPYDVVSADLTEAQDEQGCDARAVHTRRTVKEHAVVWPSLCHELKDPLDGSAVLHHAQVDLCHVVLIVIRHGSYAILEIIANVVVVQLDA